MSSSKKTSLGGCLFMDFLGIVTYFVPILGEGFDLIWAFVSAYFFHSWFGSKAGAIGNFCEEILPLTDFVPSFTIGHFISDGKD